MFSNFSRNNTKQTNKKPNIVHSSENYIKDQLVITLKKEVSSPQTKYIPLCVHSLINYGDVLYHEPLATTSS